MDILVHIVQCNIGHLIGGKRIEELRMYYAGFSFPPHNIYDVIDFVYKIVIDFVY